MANIWVDHGPPGESSLDCQQCAVDYNNEHPTNQAKISLSEWSNLYKLLKYPKDLKGVGIGAYLLITNQTERKSEMSTMLLLF